ncbi:MAG: hypothetical protein VYE73_16880 [Acidobacteriota bacterium]|nr:hypothetical protein [Acidobacteriota bacterium]
MLGLCLASAIRFGGANLALVAPILGLMLMVTALTHQLRGWLTSLMGDKRKRGTVILAITIVFVLVVNIPGLAGLYFDRDDGPDGAEKVAEVLEEGGLESEEMAAVRTASLVLPPGWLAYASIGAQRGNPFPALLAALGTMTIAGLSLARSYRTTLRLYRSAGTSLPKKNRVRSERDVATDEPARFDRMVEWDLPFSPPHAAAIATSALRMLMRAPHTKMVLLTPVVLLVVFAGLIANGGLDEPPEPLVPFLGRAAIGMAMMTIAQLLQNLFGFDGDGFRVFVLSAAPREEILLGKNLAHAPLGLGLGLTSLVLLQVLVPLRASHFVASIL